MVSVRFVPAGLQGDTVIAHINAAIENLHVAATFRVDAVGIGRGHRVHNRNALNPDVLAEQRMHRPARGIGQIQLLHHHVAAVDQVDQVRPAGEHNLTNALAGYRRVLDDYGGTILLVTHDRYLIDALGTQIWEIEPDESQLTIFEGTYSQRREERERGDDGFRDTTRENVVPHYFHAARHRGARGGCCPPAPTGNS